MCNKNEENASAGEQYWKKKNLLTICEYKKKDLVFHDLQVQLRKPYIKTLQIKPKWCIGLDQSISFCIQ